jgi:hypothetical protein
MDYLQECDLDTRGDLQARSAISALLFPPPVALTGLRRYAKHIPFVTTGLLEGANVSQLHRMWTERTSAGQSIGGWALVWLALVFWLTYYIVMLPNEKAPRWCTALGIVINSCVIFTVIYFRYLV